MRQLSIGQRIKEIRKHENITQQALADQLGLKQNTIATYEMGKITPSDRTIADICREFNVSENWLRTGEGEMFLDLGEDEELVQVLAAIQVSDDDMVKDLLISYWHLDEKEKAAIRKLIDGMIERKKEKAGQ
jgi:transcriptional regulator with XRE-family HTH domain